ncbi:MAG: type IV secretion system DotC family protein [Alphaproteobacteria bacterium]|nr:type IV secretion system DotC family protein [Alphaproteobacteria bacterium]
MFRLSSALMISLLCLWTYDAQASLQVDDFETRTPPPSLYELQNIPKENKLTETGLPTDIRRDAIKEAAFSYGARGGLAWRTYHIRDEMEGRAGYMDQVFDFRQLLIPAPSGLLIEPPIVGESLDAMIIDAGGNNAAVADRVLNISRNARIVSTARTWRAYLEREWGEVAPPPDILRPETKEEREDWARWVAEGWEEGIDQANEIFQDDLNKLVADYQGMVRYRMLLSQGMVTPPYALQTDRGVTGGGNEMRVGDRALSITRPSSLKPKTDEWSPANR